MVYNYIPFSDDTFTVADFDEQIFGYAGHDTAVFSGNRSEYTFVALNESARRVTGPEGAHTLVGIETYRFADGDYQWDFVAGGLARPHDPPAGTFRLFTNGGFVGSIGGQGKVFGTNGFQSIGIIRGQNDIVFDQSFNRGGDQIRFSTNYLHLAAHVEGSAVVLSDGIGKYTVPVGTQPTAIWTGGTELGLYYSPDWKAAQIAGQSLTAAPASLWGSDVSGPGLVNVAQGDARVFLTDDAEIVLGGNYHVFGTVGEQHVVWHSGDITLDQSFSRGGDRLTIDNAAEEFTATVSGANAVLTWGADRRALIPIGEQGMEIAFNPAGSAASDVRVLRYDLDSKHVLLGDQAINLGGPDILEAYSEGTFVIG